MVFKFVKDLMNMAFEVFNGKKSYRERPQLLVVTPTPSGDPKVFKEDDRAQQLYLGCITLTTGKYCPNIMCL